MLKYVFFLCRYTSVCVCLFDTSLSSLQPSKVHSAVRRGQKVGGEREQYVF